MIIVDTALQQREENGNPIKVALVGAGFMARGIGLQLCRVVPGIELVAVSNRHIDGARRLYNESGIDNAVEVSSDAELDRAIKARRPAITDDAMLLCDADGIDVTIEVTGAVEFGAHVALRSIESGKHVVAMNAELDATIGPILKVYADRNGVIFTNADGDQPGVIMNLYRFVKGIGVTPVLCGNIKGLQDPYRNPTTQEAFARKWGQKAHMVTSFADGSKVSFEQAIVANATGMRVARRGMHGPTVPAGTPVQEAVEKYPIEELLEGPGIVDYVVGAAPGPGIFVVGTHDHPAQKHYLNLYKLGEGPLYCFYTPYHLCHFEVHNTVARAALFHDATIAPAGAPSVEVVTTAKTDICEGDILDGIGYYMTYGQCENSEVAREERLLPMGLAEGCRLKRDVGQDEVLTFDDVILPSDRLCDKLWNEQVDYFRLLSTRVGIDAA